ncbi:MAG TPA: radical SAM protein [Planctomycetota bacterium]|nr:radical SAM protein [Planctomycetota bacterium]
MVPRVAEVRCKSALVKSGISDYAVNCYVGCSHACIYCYARFMARFGGHEGEPWGSFVDAKVNAPDALARDLARAKPGRVMLSSVCDGWQPLEEQYRLSRRCAETLVRFAFPVGILTKSGLVRRDIEVLRGGEVDVGVTLATVDEEVRRILEPGASPVADRFDVLRRAREAGLGTYVFAGPLFPFLCDGSREVDALFRAIAAANVDYVLVDTLNPKRGLWPVLRAALAAHAPHVVGKVGEMLYDPDARAHYVANARRLVLATAARHGLSGRLRLCL